MYLVVGPHDAAANNTGEHSLPGHRAVTQLLVDGTVLVALLADLADLENNLAPDTESRA